MCYLKLEWDGERKIDRSVISGSEILGETDRPGLSGTERGVHQVFGMIVKDRRVHFPSPLDSLGRAFSCEMLESVIAWVRIPRIPAHTLEAHGRTQMQQ